MMQCICDRCGAEMEAPKPMSHMAGCVLVQTQQTGSWKVLDLCQGCLQSLGDWIKGADISSREVGDTH